MPSPAVAGVLALALEIGGIPPLGGLIGSSILIVLLAMIAFRKSDRRKVGMPLVVITATVAAVTGASFASAAFCRPRPHNAPWVAMKSDLHNLHSAQAIYVAEGAVAYADNLFDVDLTASQGVYLTIVSSDASGFGARAHHEDLPDVECSVYTGESHRIVPAGTPGVVSCQPDAHPGWCSGPVGALGGQ